MNDDDEIVVMTEPYSLAELRTWVEKELASCDDPGECEKCAQYRGVAALLDVAAAARDFMGRKTHICSACAKQLSDYEACLPHDGAPVLYVEPDVDERQLRRMLKAILHEALKTVRA